MLSRQNLSTFSSDWIYNHSDCILHGVNTYYNQTTWMFFNNTDSKYNNQFFSIELQFEMHLNLPPDIHYDGTPMIGLLFRTSNLSYYIQITAIILHGSNIYKNYKICGKKLTVISSFICIDKSVIITFINGIHTLSGRSWRHL